MVKCGLHKLLGEENATHYRSEQLKHIIKDMVNKV